MNCTEEFYDAVENQEDHMDDLNETEELRRRSVHELREWAKSQPHFVNCRLDNNFLLRFLRMRKYRIDLAQQVLDKYLTIKTKYPKIYQKLDIQSPGVRDLISRGKYRIDLAQQVLDKYLTIKTKYPKIYQKLDIQSPGVRDLTSRGKYRIDLAQQVLDKYLTIKTKYPKIYPKLDIQSPGVRDLTSRGYVFPLPERDRHGRTVLFCIAGALDANRHKQSDVFKSYFLTYEALMECELNQRRGISYIFTQEGYHISHALLVGLRDLQKMVHSGEKALPLRHKELHWMNVPKYLATLFALLKTFLSQKLQERIIIHNSIDSLYEQFPPSMLPKEYGGTIPVSEMTKRWIEILETKRDRILALDNMKIDENKRPKGKPSSHFIPRLVNSFSKLELSS